MAVRFINWSQTVTACPAAWHQPGTEEEVLSLVRRARDRGQRLKAVGSGHSWSSIAATDGIMLHLGRLNRLIQIDVGRRRVTVQAGMLLHDLVRHLDGAGLSMSILGSIMEQQVAGAIATGTHGSSLRHGNLSSQVCGVRLVTPQGEVLNIGEGDERLRAARLHLGALGVITRVTLRVEPAFLLEEEARAMRFSEAVEQLEELGRSAEYVKLWWLPHTGAAQLYRYRRHEGPATCRPWQRWVDEAVVNRYLFAGVLRLSAAAPVLVPRMNRLVARAYFRPRRAVGRADQVLTVAMPPRHRETEYAVPVWMGAEVLRRLEELIGRRGLRVNLPVEVRFVRGDDAWLSPAYGRDSCQIGVYMAPCSDLAPYFSAFAAMMREMGGRPHWGKELSLTPAEVERLWPEAGRFRALARQLDPQGMMRNSLLDQVLGPVPLEAPGKVTGTSGS